jgi:hypothetical protein
MKTARITLHFLTLEIFTHSARFFEWLTENYESLDQTDKFADKSTTYSIYVEEIGSPHAMQVRPVDGIFAKFCLLNTHCYYKDGVFTSEGDAESKHQCEVDTVSRTVKMNLGGLFAQSEESFIYEVMRDLFKKIILPTSGMLNLHAAIVARGDSVICLSGEKGMGKSTIGLKLMEAGYSILSDDSPLLTSFGGKTYVLSSLDQLSVTENTLKLFPNVARCVVRQRDISGKYFVNRNLVCNTQVYGPLKITRFIELQRAEPALAKLAPRAKTAVTGELLREVMSLFPNFDHPTPNFFADVNKFQFDTISQVVSEAECFTLSYSSQHLDQLPDLLKQELREGACP